MNKKSFFSGIVALLIAIVMALNVNFNTKKNSKSSLSLANIEALAIPENDDCSDGHAKLCCTIWNVKYYGGSPPAECTTGGEWKCFYCND